MYYTEPSRWQVIEERVDTDTDPNRQFIWGRRYIDDLVVRDRDTTGNGTLDERLYPLQDANWNVTALSNTTGTIQERYTYTAYGQPTFLTPTFGSRTSSSYNWETLYAGYRSETGTELFHVRHRVLNAAIGTWVQRDPYRYSSDVNLYQYTNAMPISSIDPRGLFSWPGLCSYLTDPCSGSIIQCLCQLVGIADFISNFSTHPLFNIVTNFADCGCDVLSTFSYQCACGRDWSDDFVAFVDYLNTFGGCISDIFNVGGALLDFINEVVGWLSDTFSEHFESPICACQDIGHACMTGSKPGNYGC